MQECNRLNFNRSLICWARIHPHDFTIVASSLVQLKSSIDVTGVISKSGFRVLSTRFTFEAFESSRRLVKSASLTNQTWHRLAHVLIAHRCYCLVNPSIPNLYTSEAPAMHSTQGSTKFCWICGKDVILEHYTTDEHGLSVHKSCDEKRMLLNAASRATELWRQAQLKRGAA